MLPAMAVKASDRRCWERYRNTWTSVAFGCQDRVHQDHVHCDDKRIERIEWIQMDQLYRVRANVGDEVILVQRGAVC